MLRKSVKEKRIIHLNQANTTVFSHLASSYFQTAAFVFTSNIMLSRLLAKINGG